MKLHLPVRLFKSVLACLAAVASFSLGSGVAWAEAQNLTFSGSSLTWDTSAENKPFVDEEDAAASFAAGDNVSFTGESTVRLGENITAGTLDIAAGADVTIALGNYTLHTDTISLSGTLAVGDSLSIASGSTLAVKNAAAVLDSALVLGEKSGLVVESAASLNNNSLTLQGGSNLILTAAGDGKTYTLFSGISSLVDKTGNTLTAGSYSINDYFDKDAPGSGFWADATLVLTVDGTLQLVRHNEMVKESLEITEQQTGTQDYSYYKSILFNDISSSSSGGAIYGDDYSTISLSDNGSVCFSGNTASSSSSDAYGGAIYGYSSSTISLSDNGSVTFSGNSASGSLFGYGGAIYGRGVIVLSDNGSVEFSGNSASDDGGAIYGRGVIVLSDNGSVEFSGNSASGFSSGYGGAIYGDGDITLSSNSSVEFRGNSASSYGGAIFAYGNLSICNNDSVLFEKNAEVRDGTYRLRSIYAGNSYLSAAAGKSIEFRDSVYIAFDSTLNLNADYTDAVGVGHKQMGDIIFTGKYAETHLNELLAATEAGRTATAEEILNSRTTVVEAMTNLYGGRLRVEDGAIYKGYGITAHEDSAATVRVQNATLNHSGYDLTFNSVTTLELAGSNTLIGTVRMLDGSNLFFDFSAGKNPTDILGSLQFTGESMFILKSGNTSYGSNEVLLYASEGVTGWNDAILSTGDSLTCVDNLLVLNYDADSFNRYYNGMATYNGQFLGNVSLHHYERLLFEADAANATSSYGGSIYGYDDSIIMLSNNGSVTFSGNSSSSYGCAIYGSVTMTDNGSVTFSGNSASSSGGAIYGSVTMTDNDSVSFSGNSASRGGAIYGTNSISLDNNGSVVFSGNLTSGRDAVGGAIYGGGDITLSSNSSVEFSGNTASSFSSSGGAIYGTNSISLDNNGSVVFSGNSASGSSSGYGGAIHGFVTMTDNGNVTFSGNSAFSFGGAIYGSVTMTDNDSVSFSGNSAFRGGAIYGSVTMTDNGSVEFSGNTASFSGGAIYAVRSLHIRNNDSVEFAGNVEKEGSAYRLRSVCVSGGSDDVLNISAAAGKSVTFYDTIYVGSGTTVNLNADYEDAEGNIIEQKGDIIFTGATTVADLYKAKGNVAGTAMEILNSRTTEVRTMTNLYGGRLRMEDGAIYQGYGITVHEGSVATVLVKDATLSHSGYDLIFNAGTTLELVGDSQLAGNLMMLTGSILSLDSTMNLNGSLTLGNEVVLGGALLDDILSMKAGDTLTLVSGLESLHLQTQSLMRSLEYTTLLSGELVNASDYFENLKGHSDLVFSYDSNTQTLKIIYAIPEPATTTLSLLALAALAARRRRK